MWAVLMTLVGFRDHVDRKIIQLVSDNILTATYLNHMCGPSLEFNEKTNAIWTEAMNNHLSVLAVAKHEKQHSIRSPKSTDRQVPVANPPGIYQLFGRIDGSLRQRYNCICHNSSHKIVQNSVLSSKLIRFKRSGPARLYISQQFC